MTTPPPESPETETLEVITERLVASHDCHCCVTAEALATSYHKLRDDILSALRNERERCAKVADTKSDALQKALARMKSPSDCALRIAETAILNVDEVARSIREGK